MVAGIKLIKNTLSEIMEQLLAPTSTETLEISQTTGRDLIRNSLCICKQQVPTEMKTDNSIISDHS